MTVAPWCGYTTLSPTANDIALRSKRKHSAYPPPRASSHRRSDHRAPPGQGQVPPGARATDVVNTSTVRGPSPRPGVAHRPGTTALHGALTIPSLHAVRCDHRIVR